MKSTGIIRQLDSLGRLVLPIELRRTMDIGVKDSLEIYIEDDRIVMRKYTESCVFCGSSENVELYRDRPVCASCIRELAEKHRRD